LWRLVAREVVVLADIFGMLGACLPRGVFFPRGADASFALLCLSTSMTRWTNSSSAILNPMFSAMIYPDYHLLAAVYSLHHDQGRCKLPFTVFTGLVHAISGMTTSCKLSLANHTPGKKSWTMRSWYLSFSTRCPSISVSRSSHEAVHSALRCCGRDRSHP